MTITYRAPGQVALLLLINYTQSTHSLEMEEGIRTNFLKKHGIDFKTTYITTLTLSP
jgi:hypothetical protein